MEKSEGKNSLHEYKQGVFEKGELRVAIENNSSSYFVFKGNPMGYHYDLLNDFAQQYNLKLHLITCKTPEEAMKLLKEGECDLIAMNLTIHGERLKTILFTTPLRESYQVLVQRKPENWRRMHSAELIEKSLIRDPLELAGKTITVPEGSSYIARLKNIMQEIGDIIFIRTEAKCEEELFDAVANGEIDFTVCDDNDAALNDRYYPDIDSKTPISFKQKVAWGVHPQDTALRDSLNSYLEDFLTSPNAIIIYNKYYRYPIACRMARASQHSQGIGGGITPWDDVLIENCKKYNLDWALVASLIYQESKFDTEARSPKGAIGLMQMLPETMEVYKIDSLSLPEEQIVVGIRHLSYLNKQLEESVPDSIERTRFMLAAYNAGLGHIYDAQRLAQKSEKDPSLWSDVSNCLIEKSDPQVYRNDDSIKHGFCRADMINSYVSEIVERHQHYKTIFIF